MIQNIRRSLPTCLARNTLRPKGARHLRGESPGSQPYDEKVDFYPERPAARRS